VARTTTKTEETESERKIRETREAAEANLEYFIRLVVPKNVFGMIHQELCQWMTRSSRSDHQLILLPRDHCKSRYAAFLAIWELTKDPTKRILYISNTSTLAEKQLGFIKDIMTSSIYRRYWPEMINEEEGKRKRWTTTEIAVDHPKRAEEGIRDPSIMVAGLTTSIVGLHFDIAVLDDVVTGDNAYTEEGRSKVARQYSFLASIEGAEAREVVVGTRYHPKDLYNEMLTMTVSIFDDEGNELDKEPVYEVFEREVEDRGDGTGQFLWPRQQREDGKWYGFDQKIWQTKFAKYLDKTQFFAQYYNKPNAATEGAISRSYFQYFDPLHLKHSAGYWYINGKRINITAAVDFSYTLSIRSDYTAIAIVGIDSDRNYYVLEVDRYKTRSIKEHFEHLLELHRKWDFKKLIAEAVSGAVPLINELKESYLKPNGIMLSIEEVKPTKHDGTKQERLKAILDPRYMNNHVWHARHGNIQTLEDELVLQFPPHDDCKDAVANAMQYAVAPSRNIASNIDTNIFQLSGHPRFGGLGGR
jgi:phage terminase large subunit-like protein